MPALDEAVEKFVAMRTIEGENLKKDILLKGERIRALVAEVKERSPLVVVEYQEKLNNRLKAALMLIHSALRQRLRFLQTAAAWMKK